jgi:hypothetical protein
MQMALANRDHRSDSDGVVVLDWPDLVVDGQLHWLCFAEGEPEPEVLIATDMYGRRIGIMTGTFRSCPLPSAD